MCFSNVIFFKFLFIYLILERGREGERKGAACVTNHDIHPSLCELMVTQHGAASLGSPELETQMDTSPSVLPCFEPQTLCQ